MESHLKVKTETVYERSPNQLNSSPSEPSELQIKESTNKNTQYSLDKF